MKKLTVPFFLKLLYYRYGQYLDRTVPFKILQKKSALIFLDRDGRKQVRFFEHTPILLPIVRRVFLFSSSIQKGGKT